MQVHEKATIDLCQVSAKRHIDAGISLTRVIAMSRRRFFDTNIPGGRLGLIVGNGAGETR